MSKAAVGVHCKVGWCRWCNVVSLYTWWDNWH